MRRNETFMVAQEIHGCSKKCSVAGAVGLVDTALNEGCVRLSIHECPMPRLVPYDKLMSFIKLVNVGNI
jgi:hypothetical protein